MVAVVVEEHNCTVTVVVSVVVAHLQIEAEPAQVDRSCALSLRLERHTQKAGQHKGHHSITNMRLPHPNQ